MRKASLAIFCFLFMTLLCAASDVRIVHFDNDDGLDHNIVTCIIQDREGYIWLSSRDGLSRYDGYSFVNYKAQPGDGCPLESNRIDQIWELPDNNILCMSGHRTLNLAGCKYYVFNRKTGKFEVYRGKNLPGGSYYVADENVMRRISSLKEYEGLETRVMCEDRQGGYWVRTNRGIDRVTFVKEPLKNTKFSNFGEEVVRALHQDSQQVGMENKGYKMPNELSGGEQQRIVIARAILNKPEIILADEPTGNLDVETGRRIVELLQDICRQGSAILMTTHNLNLLSEYPGKVYKCEHHRLTETTNS